MRKFLRMLEGSFILRGVTFFVLMVLLFAVYYFVKAQLDKRFEVISDDFSWVYQVDSIQDEGKELVISGWAFELNRDSKDTRCEIVLREITTGELFFPIMSYSKREDVNEYFLCEYDYLDSGFEGRFSTEKMDLKNQTYEVFLRKGTTHYFYSMGVYYANNEILLANPSEFLGLEVEGTDLEAVVEDGKLRVYRPDVGMYVYQYEGELYWIAEAWYGFINDDSIIQFQLNTTQVKKLPAHRLDMGLLWSNIGFKFRSREMSQINVGKYRVAKCPLPNEYSITKIWTGNYTNDTWEWIHYFRPWYEFN